MVKIIEQFVCTSHISRIKAHAAPSMARVCLCSVQERMLERSHAGSMARVRLCSVQERMLQEHVYCSGSKLLSYFLKVSCCFLATLTPGLEAAVFTVMPHTCRVNNSCKTSNISSHRVFNTHYI